MEYSNVMQKPRIEKVTLNIGAGESGEKLVKAEKLLQKITNKKTIRTFSKHKVPAWNLRKGEPIGCKVTLRGKEAEEILKRMLYAKDNKLTEDNFDKAGNMAFGIHEYIDIQGLKYDPDIGILGLNVNTTLEKSGYRTKRRRLNQRSPSKKHTITRQESIDFIKEKFGVEIEAET
ncbi:MAG: 50S ribosomal protein L5 [Candidatus Altiarchaeales archaeon]|nr:50S ribosomal protein L5 [Candidatus Altiarchaeales archaeon]